ncbi:MAG: cation-translocating P-type ATPase [Patescibacteria group bacterium]
MSLEFNENFLSASYRGLSSLDAEVRTSEYGKNIRPGRRRKGSLRLLWGIMSEPMLLLLVATTVIYFFIGTHLETLIFAFSIVPVVLIEFFQERRTDRALEMLDNILVEECQVFRDGALVKMLMSELVPGDVVYISAGDKVPGDGVVIRSPGLMVDESALTGESMPVEKVQYTNNGGDSKLLQGTMVVQGEAQVVILATGGETQYGKLGNLLANIIDVETPLQAKVHDLVKKLAVAAVIIALFIGMVIGREQGLLKGLLGSLTIAMSIIPEEFPIVFSVFLIMGVWRLSKRNALVRKMVMVETLGSVTTICVDKTGTLTEGKMRLEKIYFEGKIIEAAKIDDIKSVSSLIEAAVLALERVAIDPMEIEMQRFAKAKQIYSDNFYNNFKLKKDSTFNASSKLVHHIWQGADDLCYQYTAGAPESVVALCNLDDEARGQIRAAYEKLAADGYRVVAIAKTASTVDCNEFTNDKLNFSGLIAMSDPPRYGVREALEVCKAAGIRVMMITGDHALTAMSIAGRIGLEVRGPVIEGRELASYTREKLQEVVRASNIFARIQPDQKYLIVESLQANGEIVAMTGDGVNDAPALRKATIGIAMGKKGTAVAREAAGIILLDDNFTTIVKAVEEGRRIYDNLRQAFAFLFTFHLPVIGLAIIPLLLGQGLYFLPIHVIFLELFNDPVTVLGLERDPIRRGAMLDGPRSADEPLINRQLWWRIIWQAAGILGVALWFYGYGFWHQNLTLGRTMSFTALVISQLILVLISRDISQVKQNKLLMLMVALTGVGLSLVTLVPVVNKLFHFTPLSLSNYLYTFVVSLVVMTYFNIIAHGHWGKKKKIVTQEI